MRSVEPTPGKVAVLMGGTSAERAISLLSGAGVLEALRSRGVDAHAFDPAERQLGELRSDGFERCFVALHGLEGEDGTVQGALELLRIPYTGSGVMASAIAMDKVMTKRIWLAEGLPTPRWVALASADSPGEASAARAKLGLPMIIKPSREGSSIGVHVVRSASDSELGAAVHGAAQRGSEVLCEEFVDGDEVTCAVLGSGADAVPLPVIRIVAPGRNYDYQNKYFSDETQYLVPSGLPAHVDAEIERLSLHAYRSLGCRGWGRIDIMVRARDQKPFLLELNTSPGMTEHSLVPMAARATGMSYADLCLRVLASATLDTVR